MDQRRDASSPTLPSSPPTDGSYQTPVMESVTQLIPVPEEVQLPSPTSSEEEVLPVPPPRASTPGREVSGQHCWTRRKFDKTPGAGASRRFFWRSSGLRGKDRARPYPVGCGETRGSAGDWRLRAVQHAGPSEPPATSHWPQHGPLRDTPSGNSAIWLEEPIALRISLRSVGGISSGWRFSVWRARHRGRSCRCVRRS